jgi:hypothetical protein
MDTTAAALYVTSTLVLILLVCNAMIFIQSDVGWWVASALGLAEWSNLVY